MLEDTYAYVVDDITAEIFKEAYKANFMYPPFHSAHEGLAIIQEEFDELKQEVYAKQGQRDWEAMHKEAVQTAAMCVRLIADVINPNRAGQQTGND